MPRRPTYYWDKREQAYRTDAGGRTKHFRGIPREDNVAIAQAFSDHLEQLDAARRPAEPDLTDLITAFLKADRGPKARRTRQSHKERLTKFASFPAPDDPAVYCLRAVRSFREQDLRVAVAAWLKAGHSPHYIAGLVRSVKAAFNWGATEVGGRLIAADLFKDVKAPATGRAPDRYAERSELAAFLWFVWRRADTLPEGVRRRFSRRLVLMVRIAAYTGARPGTLVSAWWDDFAPARRTITLPPDRHKTGHKTGKPLVLYLTPILARSLRRERERPDRHDASIFTHERGKGAVARGVEIGKGEPWGKFIDLADGRPSFDPRPTALCHQIRKLRRQAIGWAIFLKSVGKSARGLDLIQDEGDNRFVMYRLRHTKASDDLMAGGNPATVAALLGTSTKMLETTYVHYQDDHLAGVAADLVDHHRERRRPKPKPPGSADSS